MGPSRADLAGALLFGLLLVPLCAWMTWQGLSGQQHAQVAAAVTLLVLHAGSLANTWRSLRRFERAQAARRAGAEPAPGSASSGS